MLKGHLNQVVSEEYVTTNFIILSTYYCTWFAIPL